MLPGQDRKKRHPTKRLHGVSIVLCSLPQSSINYNITGENPKPDLHADLKAALRGEEGRAPACGDANAGGERRTAAERVIPRCAATRAQLPFLESFTYFPGT